MNRNIDHQIGQLSLIKRKAEERFCRAPVVLKGDDNWMTSLLNHYICQFDDATKVIGEVITSSPWLIPMAFITA